MPSYMCAILTNVSVENGKETITLNKYAAVAQSGGRTLEPSLIHSLISFGTPLGS